MPSSERLAIAIDLGTTTIAASLLDLSHGVRIGAAGALNPQREYGTDVVSRLDAATASPEALARMSRLVSGELERLAEELLSAVGASWDQVATVGIAGNPAMEHLLLGLSVKRLAFPPFRPLFTSARVVNAATLGWKSCVDGFVFPLPGGFVGGDLVAFLYGVGIAAPSRLSPPPSPRLFLDLGTNGEIALIAGGGIYATSAAAGPAFEGGSLACGMAALPGAISSVELVGDMLTIGVVGDGVPSGICGSAVIDTVAGLVREGVVDRTGRLRSPSEIPSNLANRVTEIGGELVFVLYRDAQRLIYLGQQDIREVQLAKGAIRAGIEVLLQRAGVEWEALGEVVLTGSFGCKLAPEGLKMVGILPGKVVNIYRFVREGALAGVERALFAPGGVAAVEELAAAIKVVPLSGTPAFEKHFLIQMNFPDPGRR